MLLLKKNVKIWCYNYTEFIEKVHILNIIKKRFIKRKFNLQQLIQCTIP